MIRLIINFALFLAILASGNAAMAACSYDQDAEAQGSISLTSMCQNDNIGDARFFTDGFTVKYGLMHGLTGVPTSPTPGGWLSVLTCTSFGQDAKAWYTEWDVRDYPLPEGCEAAPDCSSTIGQSQTVYQTLEMYDGIAPKHWTSPPEFFEVDGCQFELTETQGCQSYLGTAATQCIFTVVGTGESTTGTDSYTDSELPSPLPDNLPDGCVRDSAGNVMCNSSDECGTYQGVEVCSQPEPNCALINGTYICSNNPQNCTVSASGQRVCVQPSDGSSGEEQNTPPTGCFQTSSGDLVCVNDVAQDTTETTVTDNGDGSTTTVTTVTNNHDGTTTTTTTTTQADGSSTSTTTTSGSDANNDDQTEDEPEPDQSSYGEIDCNSPPVCDGDAILCGIAKSLWDQKCQFDTTGIPVESFFDLNVSNPLVDDGSQATRTVDVGDLVLDQTGFLTARACPSDIVIDLGYIGTTEIKLSELCGIFDIIAALVLLTATVLSMRIVLEGV